MPNRDISVLSLTNAAVDGQSANLSNPIGRGAKIVVDITAISGTTPSLTVIVEGLDPVSGKYYTILQSAALTAIGTTVLPIFPGLAAVANVSVNDVLPNSWRVRYDIEGTTPQVTATVAACLIG